MEDFFYAGGVRGLMGELKDLLHLDCLTVNGKTIGENLIGKLCQLPLVDKNIPIIADED